MSCRIAGRLPGRSIELALVLFAFSTALAVAPHSARAADEELVGLIVNLIGEKDKDLRAVGLEQVRTEAKGAAATEKFAALLPTLPADAQAALLSALADRGDPAARPAVLAVLANSKEVDSRVAAIQALGPLGEAADVAILAPLLAAESKPEKAAARASLIKLRGETTAKSIVAVIPAATPPTRQALIEVLAARRALDTLDDLVTLAVDPNAQTRAAAMTALGLIGGPEQIGGMVAGVLKAEKGAARDGAERSVALVCSRTADAEQRATPLLATIEKLAAADKLALLPALGRVGDRPRARSLMTRSPRPKSSGTIRAFARCAIGPMHRSRRG